jgi:hypothetical protein
MFIHSQKEIKMMKNVKSIFTMLAIIALIVGLFGCQDGPVEKAGKKIDKAVEDIKK